MSTTIYGAGVSITHLMENADDPLKSAAIQAVQNNYPIVDSILSARSQTIGFKANAYYDFVKADPALGFPIDNFPSQLGGVMPFITIKENKNDLWFSGMDSKILAASKALKILNLSLSSITEAVNTGEGQVDDVYVMFATNIYSDSLGTAEYFFRLFNKLYDPVYDQQWWMGFSNVVSTAWDGNNSPLDQGFKVHYITDEIEFTQFFRYLTVKHEITNGVIAPVGKFVKNLQISTNIINLQNTQLDGSNYFGMLGDLVEGRHNFDSIAVSKQISPTQYETYTIYGLMSFNPVRYPDGRFMTIVHTVGGNVEISEDNKLIFLIGSPETFVIPMFVNLTKEMSDFSEQKILSDSLILYIHTVSETKSKWYQSTWFKALVMVIVIVVVTIITWGTGTIQATLWVWGLMAAIIETAAIVIVTLAVGYALSLLLKGIIALLTPLIGAEVATVLTMVVAIAVMLYTGYANVNFADLPWAEILLKTGSAIIDTAQSALQIENAQELLKLTAEIAGFTAYAGLVTKELNRGMDLLGTPVENLLYSTVNSVLLVKETPDDFYGRTIHQGNVGILGIDAVSDYTHNKLVLPKEFPSYLKA